MPGRRDRAVLAFRDEADTSGWGTNLVITMADRRIVAMQEQRRARRARRLADVS